jgi:hypothetical protein
VRNNQHWGSATLEEISHKRTTTPKRENNPRTSAQESERIPSIRESIILDKCP